MCSTTTVTPFCARAAARFVYPTDLSDPTDGSDQSVMSSREGSC